ncbi:MAG: hypothetical protein HC929_10680 [Leptolyngbyaceae cyanobacterium SM2_5_2]|nr:hypothetical protein [Leptolyngbyaceae cyanobacterium SM2_5_2]
MTNTPATDSDSSEMRRDLPLDDGQCSSWLRAGLAPVRLVWHRISGSLQPDLAQRCQQVGLRLLRLGLVGLLIGCTEPGVKRHIVLQQSWELESGDRIAGHLVTGSLGDISIRVIGGELVAPFSGQVELAAKGFSSHIFFYPRGSGLSISLLRDQATPSRLAAGRPVDGPGALHSLCHPAPPARWSLGHCRTF